MLSRAGFIWIAAGMFAASGFAQSKPAAPAATSQAPAAQAQQSPTTQAPVTTLKANAQLVVVDVVVTDSSHKPVHGLTANDFKLAESGVPQVVKNFEEHSALTAADATRFNPMPKLPAGVYTNYTPAPASGAVNLVLLDALNTPLADQSYVRAQLLAYLKATPPGTRVAIFGLTTHLIILQGFTSDPEVLRRVLEKGVGKSSVLLDDQVGGGGIQNSVADDMEDMDIPGTEQMIANMRDFEAQTQSFQLQLRAKYTLDAMNQIARYLAAIPGRKNLIWFSGSFPIDILPDTSGTQSDPFAGVASSEDEFRDTVALLGRSQVSVYPIDARGLMTSPVFQATTTRNYANPKTGVQRMNQDQQKFFSDTAAEHATMNEMADATGGKAFVNTNGLTQAVATAIDEGSNFYTLSYTPTNSARDGKLRKIKIEVARPGVNLAYRKGYYADDPQKVNLAMKPDAATTTAGSPTTMDTLRLAMTRGAPTPGEILIKVGVMPLTPKTQTEDKPAAGNQPSPKMQGPYRRYSVNCAIEPRDLVFFHASDGKIHSDFSTIIFAYSADGMLVNMQMSSMHFVGTLDDVKALFAQGILRHDEISTPAKGEYFLRIAVHDLHRDRYGAVEVATSEVRNVVPLPPPPPAGADAAPAK
jgi:VWFA-related protein